jgi:hypothetical protein
MMAETESEDFDEFFRLVKMLGETGLIEDQLSMTAQEWFFNTPRAWSEVERLLTTQTDSNQAFVAMWFNDSVEEAFTKGIAPAIAHSGYRPLRIDQKEHNNKIDDEIIAEIRRSRFVIADFTCAPGSPRGGVYYEAGFARGLGMPVIWTCKNESMSDLHFDTRQYAHIVWGAPDIPKIEGSNWGHFGRRSIAEGRKCLRNRPLIEHQHGRASDNRHAHDFARCIRSDDCLFSMEDSTSKNRTRLI